MTPPPKRARLVLAAVLLVWLALEATLARRPDLDDHARWASGLSLTIARNYLRYGLRDGATPLLNGGPFELARESPYFDQPTGDHLALALWGKVFGLSVPSARRRTVAWGFAALIALAWGAANGRRSRGRERVGDLPDARGEPWVLALAFGSVPFVLYYDHAAFPPAVAVSAVAIAAGARLRRGSGAGRGALALQGLALLVILATSWKGILFASVWALFDLVAWRRSRGRATESSARLDGVWLLGVALVVLALEVVYLETHGGLAAWLAKGARRAGSPGPALAALLRVARYGRGLGYGHALLGLAWALSAARRLRRGSSTLADRVALELFLAPVPWFLVFRERVANHDHELMYFAPALAVAIGQTASDLRARARGSLRVTLVALMLAGTGGAIAVFAPGAIEHRDDFAEPRLLGAAARASTPEDFAVATNSTELSIAWEADRYMHFHVETLEALDALVAKGGVTRPRVFVLADKDELSALGRALAARSAPRRFPGALAFDIK